MKHKSSYISSLTLIIIAFSTVGGTTLAINTQFNYGEFINPGTWNFISGGVYPPWELRILNKLVYNESTIFPAKIMIGQNTSSGPHLHLDLGFLPNFILQVQFDNERNDIQVNEIPWSNTNYTLITLRNSYLSITVGNLKLFKAPSNEFRLDFLVFWSTYEVLFGGKVFIEYQHLPILQNQIYSLATDLAIFVVILILVYKGWIILLKRLEEI